MDRTGPASKRKIVLPVMHLLIIAAFVALFARDAMPGASPALLQALGPVWAGALSIASLAAVWLAGHLLIWPQVRGMDRGRRGTVLWADRIQLGTRLIALAVHLFNVLVLGWLDVIRGITGDLVLVDELLAVLPVLGVLGMGWWSMYPIEQRIREAVLLRDLDQGRPIQPLPTRWAYVFSTLRHQAAMVIVPVLVIYTWSELVQRADARQMLPDWLPQAGLQLAGAAMALTLMPLVLRRVWDTIHLEPGPLREDLIAMCREHRIRVREVLLWRTHGTMINGAVLGLIGPARYIMLTDALLEMLPGEQVRAVMAHELGHIRRWHMHWLAAAAIAAILLASTALWVLLAMAAPAWAETEHAQAVVLLGGIAAGLVAFGFASRRFEWQADAFAVLHLSGWRGRRGDEQVQIAPEAVSAMAGALGAVAALNHIPLHRFTWRHGSIASRQKRLMRLIGARADRLWPDREAAMVKALIAAAVLVVTAFGIFTQVVSYLS